MLDSLARLFSRTVIAAALALGTIAGAAAVKAQGDDIEEPGITCLAFGYRWSGSTTDRERIALTPIPQSFLDLFHGETCTRFQLSETSLLDWHIRYGDERSAMAAVRFLEDEFSAALKPDFPDEFASTWEIAARDVQALLERERQEKPDEIDDRLLSGATQALMALDSVKTLQAQAEQLANAEFVAGEYTRAAEAFSSRHLLEAANRVHGPAFAAMAYIDERERLGGLDAFLARRVRPPYQSDRMSPAMRDITLAVTNAFAARNEQAVIAANALTRQYYRPDGRSYPIPDLRTFWLNAYEEDDEACIADERNSLEGYEDRCEENGFEQYAFGFWYQRSRLELLAQQLGIALGPLDRPFSRGGATPRTIDLFIRHAWHEGMRYGEWPAPPEAVRLLMLSAEATASTLPGTCDGAQDQRRSIYESLKALSRAQALANPSAQPELYREVAQARLRVQDVLNACGAEIPEPEFERDNLLARSFLDQYEKLTADE